MKHLKKTKMGITLCSLFFYSTLHAQMGAQTGIGYGRMSYGSNHPLNSLYQEEVDADYHQKSAHILSAPITERLEFAKKDLKVRGVSMDKLEVVDRVIEKKQISGSLELVEIWMSIPGAPQKRSLVDLANSLRKLTDSENKISPKGYSHCIETFNAVIERSRPVFFQQGYQKSEMLHQTFEYLFVLLSPSKI